MRDQYGIDQYVQPGAEKLPEELRQQNSQLF